MGNFCLPYFSVILKPRNLDCLEAVLVFVRMLDLWFIVKVQINEFVKLGGEQLVPYYADILGAILPCISDEEEKIRVVLSRPMLLIHTITVYVNCVACACSGIALTFLFTDFFVYKVARETNEELRAIKADPAEGFDIGAILSIAKRFSIQSLGIEIMFNFDATICTVF